MYNNGQRPQVILTSIEDSRDALENLDGPDLANASKPTYKKPCRVLGSTSTSVLDRLIHHDPLKMCQ